MNKLFQIIAGLLFFLFSFDASAQQKKAQDYGFKFRRFGPRNGSLDSVHVNPAVTAVNNNTQCVKYDRSNSVSYDNIKIYPVRKLDKVMEYASYKGEAPKIKMKVFSTSPVGTKVEIQLGKKADDNYPSGVHSQYEAYTKSQNTWEELTFNFTQIPEGSKVNPDEVDKITLLFSPNTKNSDTYYFDELLGPPMVSAENENK